MKWGENSAIELLHIKKIVQKKSLFPLMATNGFSIINFSLAASPILAQ